MDILTQAEKERDTEYWEAPIENVEQLKYKTFVVKAEGWSLWVEDKEGCGYLPQIGNILRMYGKGIGSKVRGIDINGITFRYQTIEQMEEENRLELAKSRLAQIEDFQKNKSKYEEQYNRLPPVFQRRIDKFRRNSHKFEWKHMPYELFVCEEAVKIANALGSGNKIADFKNADFDMQREMVPGIDLDNRSGNTFDCACFLAQLYISDDYEGEGEPVVMAHGALCPLVGCKSYGCFSKEELSQMERMESLSRLEDKK